MKNINQMIQDKVISLYESAPNNPMTELEEMFERYSAYRYNDFITAGRSEEGNNKYREEMMEWYIKEATKQVQSDLLKEVLHIIEQEVMWYNTNNHIPDSELKENDKHWEKLQKIVKDSLKEVGENINKDIKKLAEEKNLII